MSGATSGRRVALVTGAAGFVGTWLLRSLANDGYEVHATSLRADIRDAADVAWHALDVTSSAAISSLVQQTQPSEIYHLAGISRPTDSRTTSFYDVHVGAVVSLGEALAACGQPARLLVVGSAYAYGAYDRPIGEDDQLRPLNHYGASKAAGDIVAGMLAREHDVIRVRPFNHSGPGQSRDFVLPTLVGQLADIQRGLREPVVQLGGLDSVRDFSDVRDVVQFYRSAMAGAQRGSVYNVGSGTGTTIGQLVELALEVTGISGVEVVVDGERSRPEPLPYLVADVSRAREALGWTADTPLATTIADMFAAELSVGEPGDSQPVMMRPC